MEGIDLHKNSNGQGNASLSDFVKKCDQVRRIAISLFELDHQKFIYYSRSVDTMLGYCPDELLEGGWSLWYSFLKPSERPVIKHKLSEFITERSLGENRQYLKLYYHIFDANKKAVCVKHEVSLKRFDTKRIAVSYIHDRSEKELIENCLGRSHEEASKSVQLRSGLVISEREEQVLKLIGCGLSSKQIADKLFISIHTAISHRKNLLEKFSVKNTAELIKEASKIYVL